RLTADGGLPEAEALLEGKPGDRFGSSVAIDGDFVVAGAPGYDGTSTDQGAAYVFNRLPDLGSGAGPSWTHASEYRHHDFTTTSGTQFVTNGTEVLVDDSYSQALGKRGSVYRYFGPDATLDLATQNYSHFAFATGDGTKFVDNGAQVFVRETYNPTLGDPGQV